MITQMYSKTSISRFFGLSTDTKPTDCPNGSKFYEINTGKKYNFDKENTLWREFSSGSGGTTDYTDLANKPSINNVPLVGNKTLSDLGLVNPMIIKGRVNTTLDLPVDAEEGWVYFVGLATDAELKEYVYTADSRWEFIGYNNIVIDTAMSTTSENPVQNKIITGALNELSDTFTPIAESAYEALVTKDKPLYFIYDDSI